MLAPSTALLPLLLHGGYLSQPARYRGPFMSLGSTDVLVDGPSTTFGSTDVPITELHAWADANGVHRRVRVGQSRFGGRGLVTTRAVAVGDALLQVPLSLTMSTPRECSDTCSHWAARLALELHHGCAASEKTNHLRAMPPPPSVLHRWSDEQLSELQNATLALEARRWRATRREQYELVAAAAPEGGGPPSPLDEEHFNDLFDLAASRVIGVRSDNQGGTLRLVPLVDMAQHDPHGGQFALRDGKIVLLAGRACEEGEECFLDYGERTSDEFALQYGFVPARNAHDGITVPLAASDSVEHVSWSCAGNAPRDVRDACAAMLAAMPSTLADDLRSLEDADAAPRGPERTIALSYRIAKKQLLMAVAGQPAASAETSAFALAAV